MNTPRRVIKTFKILKNKFKDVYKYGEYTSAKIGLVNYDKLLNGKNILITGGGSGIGFCIAKKCIQLGASVIITGRDNLKLSNAIIEINSDNIKSICWDSSDLRVLSDNLNKTELMFDGDIDILINNAGVNSSEEFFNVTEDVWDRMYSTNSKGVFFLTQEICNNWIKKNSSKIYKVINISSQGGFIGATYPYRMTKWDIAGLTQGLGIKLAPFGIIVNGIAPGIIATNMQPGIFNRKDNLYCVGNPLNRFALPEEIAELAAFLMSDATNFIVGQTIICDGGYSLK